MPFSPALKKEVRRKAGYQCCICQTFGVSVEVHHTIPENDEGPNTFDNAAPMCPSCHREYGANPEKKARIREMRDWLYEMVEQRYSRDPDEINYLAKIDEKLDAVLLKQSADISELKNILTDYAVARIDKITFDDALSSSSDVVGSLLTPEAFRTWNLFKPGMRSSPPENEDEDEDE
jgi:hypothetical protein